MGPLGGGGLGEGVSGEILYVYAFFRGLRSDPAQKAQEIKGFLGLERPFLDLVSQTPRPRGRGRSWFADASDTAITYKHSVLTNWGFYELTFLWDGPYFFKVNVL